MSPPTSRALVVILGLELMQIDLEERTTAATAGEK
jgi:hypothetical protein